MSLRNRRLKVLGLCLLTALLGANLLAASANAEPEYYVDGTLLAGEEEVEYVAATPFTLSIPLATVKCEVLTGSGTIRNVNGAGRSSGVATFLGCSVTGVSGCTLLEPASLVFTDRLIGHGGQIYDVHEQLASFLSIFTFTGEACSLPEEVVLKGSTTGLVQAGEGVNRTLTFSEGTDKLIGSQILWGFTKAFLTGQAEVFLTGANIGKKWGAK